MRLCNQRCIVGHLKKNFFCLCTVILVLDPHAIAVCAQVIQNDCVNFMLIVSLRAIKVKSPHYKSLLGGYYSF